MPKKRPSSAADSNNLNDNNNPQHPPIKKRKLQQNSDIEGFVHSPSTSEKSEHSQSRPSQFTQMNDSNDVGSIVKSLNSKKRSKTPSRSNSVSSAAALARSTPIRHKNANKKGSKSLSLPSSLNSADPNAQTACITINGVTENIDMKLLRNIGYFHRKLARPSMEIDPDKKSGNSQSHSSQAHAQKNSIVGESQLTENADFGAALDDLESYKFEFNVEAFDMTHFLMLLKYVNFDEREHKNGEEMERPKIDTDNVLDLEKFVFAADYFLVYNVASNDIEQCYSQCQPIDSTHDLLKKWKKCKLAALSEFASHLQRKLHPLSSKIGVDKLIGIMDEYVLLLDECEVAVEDEGEYEQQLIRLRTSLQIYWIHYIKGKTYFWNIYSILKKMNEFLTKLKAKLNGKDKEYGDAGHADIASCKFFDHLPFVTLVYSYIDFVNCVQRMKESTTNYTTFIEKMNGNIKELILLFFKKSAPDYNISELRKRWYFRVNDGNVSNKEVMIELIKTLIYYSMSFHFDDFMIRFFWSMANHVFMDEEYVRAVIAKCNQMEITQLAEILNGCNITYYATNQNFEFKYNDIILKHCYSSINHNDNVAVLGWR